MASLLTGVELLKQWGAYSVIFPFILIVALVYGALSYLKPFGDNQSVNIIISLVFGLLFISARSAVRFVSMLIPFVMVIFIVLILILMIFRFAGADEGMISEALKHTAGYGSIIGVLVVAIFVFISFSFPELTPTEQQELSDGNGDSTITTPTGEEVPINQEVLRQTIFHPTIVGIIVMLLVFGAATYVVTSRPP